MSRKTEKLYFQLLLLFPVFTLFQSISFLGWINKALLVGVILLQLTSQFENFKVKKKWLGILITLLIVHVYALTQTKFPLYNSNMLFYFGFWMLLVIYFLDFPDRVCDALASNLTYIKYIVIIWNIIVGISALFPSSYVVNKTWGSGRYFVSIVGDPFRLAPSGLMITTLVLVLFCFRKNKKDLVFLFIPMYTFLMCGSRTYLGVGLLVVLAFWYIYCEKKSLFYLSLTPLVGIFIFLILHSAAWAKINSTVFSTSNYLGKLGTITNGRTIFWVIELQCFFRENILNQFLGCGFNYDYRVTEMYYSSAHWAHNDFISILLNFGYVGLIIYLISVWKLLKEFVFKVKLPFIVTVLIILIWFINAFFNMFYTYTCSMVCFPILLISLKQYYLEKRKLRIKD